MKITNHPATTVAPNLVFNPLDFIDFTKPQIDLDEGRMAINDLGRLAMVKERKIHMRRHIWEQFPERYTLTALSLTKRQLGKYVLCVIRDVDGLWGLGTINAESMVATFTYHQNRKRVFDTYQRPAEVAFPLAHKDVMPGWNLPERVNEARKTAAFWKQRAAMIPLQLVLVAWDKHEIENSTVQAMLDADNDDSLLCGVTPHYSYPLAFTSDTEESVQVIIDHEVESVANAVHAHPKHRLNRIGNRVLSNVSKGK